MYYHVRLDKILHNGRTDIGARVELDFRSLAKALATIMRCFGAEAINWHIQDLTERVADIMQLESDLRVALESTHQYIVMTLKDDSPVLEKYDHFEFFVVRRDEREIAPNFTFSEEYEVAIESSATERSKMVDLYKEPIDANLVSSFAPVYDNLHGLFCGMAIMLKDGTHFVVIAGINNHEESFNLGVKGLNKGLVMKILPSTPDGVHLHGFIVRLKSGDSLYLTIGRLFCQNIQARTKKKVP